MSTLSCVLVASMGAGVRGKSSFGGARILHGHILCEMRLILSWMVDKEMSSCCFFL